jgi:hypothetical protein
MESQQHHYHTINSDQVFLAELVVSSRSRSSKSALKRAAYELYAKEYDRKYPDGPTPDAIFKESKPVNDEPVAYPTNILL